MLAAKELAAKEALARSQLAVERSLEGYKWLERFAALAPYLLMGLAALATIGLGAYATNRLRQSDRERRKETIERITDDAMHQPVRDRRIPAR